MFIPTTADEIFFEVSSYHTRIFFRSNGQKHDEINSVSKYVISPILRGGAFLRYQVIEIHRHGHDVEKVYVDRDSEFEEDGVGSRGGESFGFKLVSKEVYEAQ